MRETLDALARNYQESKDDRWLAVVLDIMRTDIQTRAYNAARVYGVDEADVESALCVATWKAACSWDETTNVPFEAWLVQNYKLAIAHLIDGVQEKKTSSKYVELVYTLSTSTDEYDLYDPKQDVENLLVEQDEAQHLYNYIADRDKVSALIVALKATGRDYKKIAKLLGYAPNVKNKTAAQKMWCTRKVAKARVAATRYYLEQNVVLPRNFRL